MGNILIAPSLLAANFLNLENEIKMLNESQADYIHLDVMDGMFVPNISYGVPVIQAIQKVAKKPFDIHLMIEKPERYLETYIDLGAKILSIHIEACTHLHRAIDFIKSKGCLAGVAINPHTSVDVLADIIKEIDVVNVMSVNPGFGGQKFIQSTYSKINRLHSLIKFNNAQTMIQIDGGVNLENAAILAASGADLLVAGAFVFSSDNPKHTIELLKNID
ncbi:MAG: ribulose-phosphate 3-epimerase [Opitutaceae bacterium]|nr:ribulose-phosphate 3-epimerase [Cytophagales bacterium]